MPTQTHAEIVRTLTSRWPENRVAPSLGRIRALTELLGDPQHAYPVIHVTGTNGKGSTAAMIESLLRADGLRTGRFTSPHVTSVNERIAIDGEPIDDERFDELWRELEPYVADGDVAVITPIDLDHTHLLGETIGEIATEKAGIIKPGAHAVLAGQPVEAASVLLARCTEVGALVHLEGVDFGLISRQLAVGGQIIRLNGAEGPIDDIFLPLHGAHQAANAAQALAAVEAFLGMKALPADAVREGFAAVRFPGRLELVRRSPSVVLDAAHNPHGARATAEAIVEAYAFSPLIGVLAVMADKDVAGLLRTYEPVMDRVIVTQVRSTSRGLPAADLGELAAEVFGPERVIVVPELDNALEEAVAQADSDGAGVAGVLVTGSVVLVGEARNLLVRAGEDPLSGSGGRAGDGPRSDDGFRPEDYRTIDGDQSSDEAWATSDDDDEDE